VLNLADCFDCTDGGGNCFDEGDIYFDYCGQESFAVNFDFERGERTDYFEELRESVLVGGVTVVGQVH